MTGKEIREYYTKQIEWYTKQVEWDTKQIEWYSKMMKWEKKHYGFETIQYNEYKKQRSRYYRGRTKHRKNVERYKNLLEEFNTKRARYYDDLREEKVEETKVEVEVEVEVEKTVVENKVETKEYTKFNWTPFYPGSISVIFHNPKNGKYMYTLQTWVDCFTFKPQDNKSIENNREVLRFYRKEGFKTFRDVLNYIEKYF